MPTNIALPICKPAVYGGSMTVVKEQAAVEQASNLQKPTGRWWRRKGVRIEKRL